MPKSRSTQQRGRTKRAHRDPSPQRRTPSRAASKHQEYLEEAESDGRIIEELDEFDTDRYEFPPPRK